MDERIFEQQTYGKIALEKIKPTDENFRLYAAGWMETGGDPSTWDTMEVTGAVFRVAKTGPRKGLLSIIVKGTERKAYVTVAEMKAFDEASKPRVPEFKYEPNHCNCHPETCGCNPYKITDRRGNKLTTAFTEDQAQKIVDILENQGKKR